MATSPLTMSPSYVAMVRGIRELHLLLAAGKDDSPEADAIRDATDGPWESLSEAERNRVRRLSEDLYSLVEPPPDAQPMSAKAQAKLNEAFESKQCGDWDRALDLLRSWRAHIDPALVSYLRGSIWLGAGDPGTAALFLKHAYDQESDDEKGACLAMYLDALNVAEPARALQVAEDVLREHHLHSPAVVSRAANIKFVSGTAASVAEAHKVVHSLEPILHATLAKLDREDLGMADRSACLMMLMLLGQGHELLGKSQAALEYYSRGLRLDPAQKELLIARGILLYGNSPRAIKDFETAIGAGTDVIWPHFFLAHHHLLNGNWEDCRRYCERALGMKASPAVLGEAAEWMAIAMAMLGFPAEAVRASFEDAIRHDPSSERAKGNLAAFESAVGPLAADKWRTSRPGAIQALVRADLRSRSAADARNWGGPAPALA